MWFAALNPRHAAPWLQGLTLRLLEGSPRVLELLGENPFPDRPPRYVRGIAYRYEFATPTSGGKTGPGGAASVCASYWAPSHCRTSDIERR